MTPIYVSIQQEATGKNIRRLMKAVGIRVKDVQTACGFEQPQAVYKWLNGQSLPSLDNLLILSILLHTSMEGILVTNGEALLPFYFAFFYICRKKADNIRNYIKK